MYLVPKTSIIYIVCIIILTTYYAINNYHSLNITGVFLSNLSVFNLLLSNPVNKYHPLLLYLTSLVILLFLCKMPQTNYKYTTNFYIKNSLTLTLLINYLLTVTLYFGAWWALQEGSWGGWWNWDSSEVFGLIILTASLTLLHTVKIKNTLPSSYLEYLYLLIIPLSYLFVQLNFDIISHNFGIREVSPINTNNYLTLSTLVIIYYLKSINTKVKNTLAALVTFLKKHLTDQSINPNANSLLLVTILSIITLLYLPSFYPLINNICWKCLQVNLLNSLYTEYFVLSFLWVIVLILFTVTRFILIILYLTPILPKILLPFTYIKPLKTLTLHFFIIILLLSAFVYNTSVFIVYEMFNNVGITQNIYTLFTSYYSAIYNNFTITSEITHYLSNHPADYINNQVNAGIGDLPQNFLHLLFVDDLSQTLNNGLIIYPHTVNIFEISSSQVNSIFLVVMIKIFYYSKLKSKIVL
jgi:cytochrome c biogenesis factor